MTGMRCNVLDGVVDVRSDGLVITGSKGEVEKRGKKDWLREREVAGGGRSGGGVYDVLMFWTRF